MVSSAVTPNRLSTLKSQHKYSTYKVLWGKKQGPVGGSEIRANYNKFDRSGFGPETAEYPSFGISQDRRVSHLFAETRVSYKPKFSKTRPAFEKGRNNTEYACAAKFDDLMMKVQRASWWHLNSLHLRKDTKCKVEESRGEGYKASVSGMV